MHNILKTNNNGKTYKLHLVQKNQGELKNLITNIHPVQKRTAGQGR